MIESFELARPEFLHLFWALPLLGLVAAYAIARRRQALERFGLGASEERPGAKPARSSELFAATNRRRWLRVTVLAMALALVATAALQPRGNPERTTFRREARDIVVVLDVSRSMLADDLKPNRLERAKLELERFAESLEGDRVGLVAFAGDAVVVCPLTSNYSYFRSAVKNISTRSASQGGTRIGDAVRKALRDVLGLTSRVKTSDDERPGVGETVIEDELRQGAEERFADILLITDGEDHDSFPIRAAEQAYQHRVPIKIIGLGSERGTPIPVVTESGERKFLEYEGKRVLSKLDTKTLTEMAAKTGGHFSPVGTANIFDLVEIYQAKRAEERGREIAEEAVSWTEIFQPFLLAGIVFYLLYLFIGERPREQEIVEWTELSES